MHLIDPQLVAHHTWQLRNSACPVCEGPGPIDMRTSTRVASFLIFTQTQSFTHVGCEACTAAAVKRDLASTALAGWWSWIGIVLTPVTLVTGLLNLRKKYSDEPSHALYGFVRGQLMTQLAQSVAAQHHALPPQDRPLRLGGSWQ